MRLSTGSVFLPVVFSAFVTCVPTSLRILKEQCWYELPPLISIGLQSSKDGKTELVIDSHSAVKNTKSAAYKEGNGADINSTYFPWSYAPVCTLHFESIGSKLCVYTNSSFSNGRGISIFTTPAIALEFTNLPAFQDATVLTDRAINVESGAWYTQQLPGRGVGMLASKSLSFGDRVTAYTPALLAFLEGELSTLERDKYLRIAVSQLPPTTRDSFLSLSYIYGDERIRVQDIVKANTFQLNVGGSNHLAVFPETSRLNHACAPNAQYYLDSEHLTHFVHATRPIMRGEEISISYASPLEWTDTRQKRLQEGFHFTCTCPRCTAAHTTDSTFSQIIALQVSLNDWSDASTGTPELAENLLQLYRQEGLEGFLDVPYGFASLAYNSAGDEKTAVEYATKAKEAILMKDGVWSPNMRLWNELLEEPKHHWSYKRRV